MKKSNLLILMCCILAVGVVGCSRSDTETRRRVFNAKARADELMKTNALGMAVVREVRGDMGIYAFRGVNAYQEGSEYYMEAFLYDSRTRYGIQKISGQGYADLTNKMREVGFDLDNLLQRIR